METKDEKKYNNPFEKEEEKNENMYKLYNHIRTIS